MYSDKLNVNILTSLLVAHGVKHVVVCPGSRNVPLVHNFNECPDIVCHPVTDERSAGFIALGLRMQLDAPVAVCVTSGSALLNVMPAAAEATYQHQGIIVISADRPAAWIDQLDGQTLPQQGALGSFVSRSVQLPEPHDDTERWHCNRLVNEVLIANATGTHPSVHINVPITEPFFSFGAERLPDERLIRYSESFDDLVADDFCRAERPLVVIGQMPYDAKLERQIRMLATYVPVLAEPLSSGYNPMVDQLIYKIGANAEAYQPDCVVYLGGHTISKRLRQFMRTFDCPVWMVNESGRIEDVSMRMTGILVARPSEVISQMLSHANSPSANLEQWEALRSDVERQHDNYQPAFSQMLAVKLFEEQHHEGDTVHYANSMSLRLAAIYAQHYFYCNRGLNGIEGSLSVAAGQSLANLKTQSFDFAQEPKKNLKTQELKNSKTYIVIGDLSFFYDENALWQQELGGNFRILLLNNSQGGIFRNLKGLEQSPVRDSYVSAHHDYTAEGICQQFCINYKRATDEQSLREGLAWLRNTQASRPLLLEVITDVNADEKVYKQYYKYIQQ